MDCPDVQAGLRLCCSQTPEDRFFPIDAHKVTSISVTGIQGQLWTELVRTSDQMDFMIFPRLLCVAERGWHKASWEEEQDVEKRKEGQNTDWYQFATTLGKKELARLDRMDVAYRLPPPGAHCS